MDNDGFINDDDVSDLNDYQPYNKDTSGVAVYYLNATGSGNCPAATELEIYATVNGVLLGNLAVDTYQLIELDTTENTEVIFYNAADDAELNRLSADININGFRVGIDCTPPGAPSLVDFRNVTFIE